MKAILIVDIPNNLKYEDLYFEGRILYTTKSDIGFKFLKELSLCLLKPIPEKLDNPYDEEQGGYLWEKSFVVGYNQCLDDILGDTE